MASSLLFLILFRECVHTHTHTLVFRSSSFESLGLLLQGAYVDAVTVMDGFRRSVVHLKSLSGKRRQIFLKEL